jgi:[ribosomal protein S18]-alanine N-acetyltransferase
MLSMFRRTPQLIVSPLGAEAAQACAGIHRKCFAYPWSASEIETMVASAGSVAHAGIEPASGRLLGFVISRKVIDEAEVLTIAVDPDFRKIGVGAALLESHLKDLAMARVRRLFLEVEEGNAAARKLYAKFAFSEAGRREGYYRASGGARAAALVLRKDVI